MTDVRFADLSFADGAALTEGIYVDAHYGDRNPSCPDHWAPARQSVMANYTFERIYGRATHIEHSPFLLNGAEGRPVTGVLLRDVHLPAASAGVANWSCAFVSGSAIRGTVEPWPPCPGIEQGEGQ